MTKGLGDSNGKVHSGELSTANTVQKYINTLQILAVLSPAFPYYNSCDTGHGNGVVASLGPNSTIGSVH